MLTSLRNPILTVAVQLRKPCGIGGIKGHGEGEGSEGSRGSGAADQMVAGALAGVLRRGGGRRGMPAARTRGRREWRRGLGGPEAHHGARCGLGEAGKGSEAPESTATADGRR